MKRKRLHRLRLASDNYIAEIYEGLSLNEDLRTLIKRIRRIKALNLKMGLPQSKPLERYCLRLAKELKAKQAVFVLAFPMKARESGKKDQAPTKEELGEWAYKALNKANAFDQTSKIGNEEAKKVEIEEKRKLIDEYLKEDKGTNDEAKIFYLCSKHMDCAEDHEAWQGRLYYDRFWRRYVKDEKAREKILAFISDNELNSLQWVLNRPVWMITRPNCRHYLTRISASEVMSGASVDELLQDHDMIHAVGKRDDGQTLRHSTKADWYTKENAKAIIRKYEERLEYHQKLYAKNPTGLLESYIEKDKRLISKWKRFLSTLTK